MFKIRWFQRRDEPMDVVEQSTFPHQAGAYGDRETPQTDPPQTGSNRWRCAPTTDRPRRR